MAGANELELSFNEAESFKIYWFFHTSGDLALCPNLHVNKLRMIFQRSKEYSDSQQREIDQTFS